MVRVGQPAPLRAGPLDLRLYRGRNLVLVFYRGAWCPVCDLQLRGLARDYGKFRKRNAEIAGVSNDPEAVSRAARSALRLPFPLVSDPGGAAIRRWGVTRGRNRLNELDRWSHGLVGLKGYAQPAVFVVDAAGRVRYARIGADPLDRPSNAELLKVLGELRKRRRAHG
ncbi:MAG: peroxiredoxin family protein [Halobacteria archaeon]